MCRFRTASILSTLHQYFSVIRSFCYTATALAFRYEGPNMATTYEQQESDEDGDPWKDSKLSNHNDNPLPPDLIKKSMPYKCNLKHCEIVY